MQFVPLWTSILNSRKVAGLPDDLYRMWTLCLVVAQEHDHRYGTLPTPDDLSYRLHLEPDVTMSRLSRLSRAGFIEECDGVYSIHDWEDWKHRPDPTATARKRAQRERERQNPPGITSTNGEHDQSNDVTVTGVTPKSHGCHAPTNLTSPDLNSTHTPLPPEGDEWARVADSWIKDGDEIEEPFVPPAPDRPAPPMDPAIQKATDIAALVGGDIGWGTWASNRIKLGDKPEWIEPALQEAVDANTLNTHFVGGILKRYKREGGPRAPLQGPGKGGRFSDGPLPKPKIYNSIAGP